MTVNLAHVSDAAMRTYCAGFGDGFLEGMAQAFAEIDAADDRMWAELARPVRKQAASPRFSQICDRRGDHEKADRARRWEREHGLALIR